MKALDSAAGLKRHLQPARGGSTIATFDLVQGGPLPLAASLLVAALGVGVLFLRPVGAAQRWFATYAITFGIATAISRFSFGEDTAMATVAYGIIILGSLLAAFAALAMVRAELGAAWDRRRAARILLASLAPIAVTWLVLWNAGDAASAWAAGGGATPSPVWRPMWSLNAAALITVGAAMAILAAHAPRLAAAALRRAALVSSAFTLFPAFFLPTLLAANNPFADGLAVAGFGTALLVSAAWLWATPRAADPRAARNAALAPLAFALAGITATLTDVGVMPGVARIAFVLLLAYAVLRHRALGIDVKLRWGISKGTLAAVFIAAFFIVSEAAQQFFGEAFESGYAGILAAGALVFAIAPLSRLADRLAEKAVPVAQEPPPASTASEERYRAVVARFLANGGLEAEEERMLAHLADDLGISGGRAFDIRREMDAALRKP